MDVIPAGRRIVILQIPILTIALVLLRILFVMVVAAGDLLQPVTAVRVGRILGSVIQGNPRVTGVAAGTQRGT